jgi:hypothetical protein
LSFLCIVDNNLV